MLNPIITPYSKYDCLAAECYYEILESALQMAHSQSNIHALPMH
ncbi:protein of unknown function [Candidatus Nitrosotalea okcheonensis]|uniref:Uncharacterized protein n=1 Tax=Candidatus Nitrosotalea okcheonensis TaxID=1903276 RepID=A0A2H1FDN2_9ARCH|nr:protein of unknown function [Candidatus Nitrosotalea okcheonensis]